MKNILIVIHNLRIGGAQKSLMSFLRLLQAEENYTVSVMAVDPMGELASQLPERVTLVMPPRPLRWLGTGFDLRLLREQFSLAGLWGEGLWLIRKTLGCLPGKLNLQQKLWRSWKRYIPKNPHTYDVAIAYMDGVPAYYVMDKVRADKKVLWIHSQYADQGYCPCFDRSYFEKADRVITVSKGCRQVLIEDFPQLTEKFLELPNISSPSEILKKSREELLEPWPNEGLRLLTVARLHPQKGVDIGIEAAKRLKEQGVSFCWIVAGDGEERKALQEKVETYGLEQQVIFLGSCPNPYPYMAQCHILVQPSRVEGKSIVLDEAKILCKPIIATRYQTVTDSLTHGETGWVVDMTPDALAEGILQLCEDAQLRLDLSENLKRNPQQWNSLLEQYLNTMFLK